MAHSDPDLWLTLRSPDAAVGAFLEDGDSLPRAKPDVDEALERAATAANEQPPVSDGVFPRVIALTGELGSVDEDTWGVLITQAARTFRSAEACLTARLGPGRAVEIDEETWVPSGLPKPVLRAASCTTSLVASWPMEEGGWCVLEVDQETSERPIAVILYRVEG